MGNMKAPATIAAGNGIAEDSAFGAVVPPLYLSSTFAFDGFGRPGSYDYSRSANPNRAMLADTLTKLEGGAGAVVTPSGLAALDLILSRLERDSLIIAPQDCYAGTARLLDARAKRGEFSVKYLDQTNRITLDRVMREGPTLVLIETPSNPLLRIVDISAMAKAAKRVGAKLAVDNTFLSPALQRPFAFGADYVIHSTTKYLNGHSDVVGGAIVAKTEEDAEYLIQWANVTGAVAAPFDCYMTLRGVRTLFPRMERQQRTAGLIASFLQQQSKVAKVYYPGLKEHPGHEIAARQQDGFGAMLSFELSGGPDAVCRFVEGLEIFTLAESLGGIESLIAHPKTMTHSSLSSAAMERAGISDNLLRLSIGLEDQNDLVGELSKVLEEL